MGGGVGGGEGYDAAVPGVYGDDGGVGGGSYGAVDPNASGDLVFFQPIDRQGTVMRLVGVIFAFKVTSMPEN